MRLWAEWTGALTLLTRVPAVGTPAAPAQSVWAFPLVGFGVGLLAACVMAACMALGVKQPLAGLWALAAMAFVTGALHEDGLADVADGFGGGRDRGGKLAIMRDSRIGSYGALALAFSLALRAAALSVAPHPLRALVLAAVLGRGAMLLPALLLPPARTDGLGALLVPCPAGRASVALGLAALCGAASLRAAIAAALAGLAVTALARRQIGGFTGDVLGAAEQAAECAVLSAMA